MKKYNGDVEMADVTQEYEIDSKKKIRYITTISDIGKTDVRVAFWDGSFTDLTFDNDVLLGMLHNSPNLKKIKRTR